MTTGSSPLSRGIPGKETRRPAGGGIIPALAGNTSSVMALDSPTGDHPRSRGEYSSAEFAALTMTGSSPLSRGIPYWLYGSTARKRIIPALAGNTGCRTAR